MTHFRTSANALEADALYLRATDLITRPGTAPSITIPVAGDRWPDVDGVWSYLREPAEFFGTPMPDPAELTRALGSVSGGALTAVTLVITDRAPHVRVSATAVRPLHSSAVRIVEDRSGPQVSRAGDPWWRRMAARTTSRAEVDQYQRWLAGRGFADGLSEDRPLLGALVFETSNGALGVENPEPTSVLDQLAAIEVITPIARVAVPPADAVRAWWVSPRYETHPVADIAGTRFPVDETTPPFARWS